MEIDHGIYVERNTSTWIKISLLRRLFALYHLDPSNLIFYLRDENRSEEDEENGGTRFEIRKKYWTFALPMIQEANSKNGTYDKSKPTKENWSNGSFGIPGFHFSCVVTYTSARVELRFTKSESAENKKAFDLIAEHKEAVEKALGVNLIWDRGEDKKVSRIYYEIDEIGIDNEDNWAGIAAFHSKWTARFYEEIVEPFLIPEYKG